MALLIYPIHLPVEVNSKIVYIFLIVCFTIRCSGGSKALLHFILSHDGLKRLLMLCYSPTAQILINDVNINLGPTTESRALNCDLPLGQMLFFYVWPKLDPSLYPCVGYIPGPFGLLFVKAPTHILEWNYQSWDSMQSSASTSIMYQSANVESRLYTVFKFKFNQLLIFIEKFSPLPGFEPGTSRVPSRYANNWTILAWVFL